MGKENNSSAIWPGIKTNHEHSARALQIVNGLPLTSNIFLWNLLPHKKWFIFWECISLMLVPLKMHRLFKWAWSLSPIILLNNVNMKFRWQSFRDRTTIFWMIIQPQLFQLYHCRLAELLNEIYFSTHLASWKSPLVCYTEIIVFRTKRIWSRISMSLAHGGWKIFLHIGNCFCI